MSTFEISAQYPYATAAEAVAVRTALETELPAYARWILPVSGAWRRRWLDVLLRLTVKHSAAGDRSIGEMRARQARLDERFGRVDFTLSGRSMVANAGRDAMLSLADFVSFRSLYAPPERYLDPSVSPLFGDFAGLPPLLFQAGSHEMAVDESTCAAAKAHASGVHVELEIWDRMPHVFQAMHSLPQAAQAADHVCRFVASHAGW